MSIKMSNEEGYRKCCGYTPHLKGEDRCACSDAPCHDGLRNTSTLERIAYVVLVSSSDLAEQDQHLEDNENTEQKFRQGVPSGVVLPKTARPLYQIIFLPAKIQRQM